MATISRSLPPALTAAVKRLAHEMSRIDYLRHREVQMKGARERVQGGEDVQVITAEIEAQAHQARQGGFFATKPPATAALAADSADFADPIKRDAHPHDGTGPSVTPLPGSLLI